MSGPAADSALNEMLDREKDWNGRDYEAPRHGASDEE